MSLLYNEVANVSPANEFETVKFDENELSIPSVMAPIFRAEDRWDYLLCSFFKSLEHCETFTGTCVWI